MKEQIYGAFKGTFQSSSPPGFPPLASIFYPRSALNASPQTSFHMVKGHRDSRSRVDLGAVIGDRKNPFWMHSHQRGSDRVDDGRHV
jgi:hypothetical protein